MGKLKISVSSGIHVSIDMQLYTFCVCHKYAGLGKLKISVSLGKALEMQLQMYIWYETALWLFGSEPWGSGSHTR